MSLNSPGPPFPGGYSWEFLVGGSVPLRFSYSWPYFRPKYLICYTRFQLRLTKSTPRSRAGLEEILLSSFRFRAQTKRFLKIRLEFAYYLFFLIHLELKWQLRSYTPVGPSKIISDSRPKWGNSVPFSDWIGTKPYPLGLHMPVRLLLENTPGPLSKDPPLGLFSGSSVRRYNSKYHDIVMFISMPVLCSQRHLSVVAPSLKTCSRCGF